MPGMCRAHGENRQAGFDACFDWQQTLLLSVLSPKLSPVPGAFFPARTVNQLRQCQHSYGVELPRRNGGNTTGFGVRIDCTSVRSRLPRLLSSGRRFDRRISIQPGLCASSRTLCAVWPNRALRASSSIFGSRSAVPRSGPRLSACRSNSALYQRSTCGNSASAICCALCVRIHGKIAMSAMVYSAPTLAR